MNDKIKATDVSLYYAENRAIGGINISVKDVEGMIIELKNNNFKKYLSSGYNRYKQ